MLNITTKFEINIEPQTPIDPIEVADFSLRWKIPAIVTHPAMFHHISMAAATRNARAAVGMTLDFPRGDNFGANKVNLLPGEAPESAFFDILLGNNRTEADYKNEIRFLGDFIRSLNPMATIRYTLDTAIRTEECVNKVLKVLQTQPCDWIRTNHFTHSDRKIDHEANIQKIRSVIATPIKISGSIGVDEVIKYSKYKNVRFDISFENAKNIVKRLSESSEAIAVNKQIGDGDIVYLDGDVDGNPVDNKETNPVDNKETTTPPQVSDR